MKHLPFPNSYFLVSRRVWTRTDDIPVPAVPLLPYLYIHDPHLLQVWYTLEFAFSQRPQQLLLDRECVPIFRRMFHHINFINHSRFWLFVTNFPRLPEPVFWKKSNFTLLHSFSPPGGVEKIEITEKIFKMFLRKLSQKGYASPPRPYGVSKGNLKTPWFQVATCLSDTRQSQTRQSDNLRLKKLVDFDRKDEQTETPLQKPSHCFHRGYCYAITIIHSFS